MSSPGVSPSLTARLLRALNVSATRLFGPDVGYASDQEAILSGLRMVEAREVRGDALFASWSTRLAADLTRYDAALDIAARTPDLAVELAQLQQALAGTHPATGAERDAAEAVLVGRWAALAGHLAADTRLPTAGRMQLLRDIAASEMQTALELSGGLPTPDEDDFEVTAPRLQVYLADRFAEPDLQVTGFRALPGGYGKETSLFTVAGKALDGEFVMRRDRLVPTLDDDCHRIDREYPVIRAAHERGFPAPDALWLDTDHALLPGGDFIVMRRAPGVAGGDVFSAAGAVSAQLTELLATSIGRLHCLPPLRELGRVSATITPELWDLSLRQVTERYIATNRDLYVAGMAFPNPAVLALYGWLLTNIPDAPGRPVLLHGDIGFHNFLVDEGRLSAVVDWEFAHIGDPAEDVGYARNTSGGSIDWAAFTHAYRAAGGPDIDPERLRFFRMWGHLRNLAASQLTSNAFRVGKLDDLKVGHVGHSMMPDFLNAILAVMAE